MYAYTYIRLFELVNICLCTFVSVSFIISFMINILKPYRDWSAIL